MLKNSPSNNWKELIIAQFIIIGRTSDSCFNFCNSKKASQTSPSFVILFIFNHNFISLNIDSLFFISSK
jgi:hypothetical protein